MITKKERKRRLKEKYYSKTEKAAVLMVFIIIFVSLGYGIYYSLISGADPFITAILVLVFFFIIFLSILLIDTVFYEGGG